MYFMALLAFNHVDAGHLNLKSRNSLKLTIITNERKIKVP